MKKLSRFDISMIVAFLVVALVGGGGAYYLDAFQLDAATQDVKSANDDFNKYTTQMPFLPTRENLKILNSNVDLIGGQIDQVVKSNLQAPGNDIAKQVNSNTVSWKHKLDENVGKLNASAKLQGVQVPANYYYGFSSYLSRAPTESKTGVLSRQLLATEEMARIMIGAPVNAIKAIRRTEEESDLKQPNMEGASADFLPGRSALAAGGLYLAYPFEIDFDATTDAMRKVVDGLMQSPYVFIIRGISVENSNPTSPQLDSLATIAGTNNQGAPSVNDSPGAVAAAKSTAGPQYLFGAEILHVRIRIDLIEWIGQTADTAPANKGAAGNKTPGSGGKQPAPGK